MAVACLLLLAGCEHYVDLTPSAFLQGTAAPAKFAQDNAACQQKADAARLDAGGNGDPHGIYNRFYRACMRGLGYRSADPEGFGGW